EPSLCALWTSLAREEEEHAHSIALARARLEPSAGWRTWLEGGAEALGEGEARLAGAEDLGAGAPIERQLSAALELEMTDLEALRHVLIAACDLHHVEPPDRHALRLADAAERITDDPQVRLQAALLRARTRLKKSA